LEALHIATLKANFDVAVICNTTGQVLASPLLKLLSTHIIALKKPNLINNGQLEHIIRDITRHHSCTVQENK
jgi:hypothetical protein